VATLKRIELERPIAKAARQRGPFCRRKKQSAGLALDDVREFHVLQEEKARLKRLVADLSLGKPRFVHTLHQLLLMTRSTPSPRYDRLMMGRAGVCRHFGTQIPF